MMPERGVKSGKFLFLGNYPCLDFINTEIMQGGRRLDLLGNSHDLLAWSEEAGLTARTRPESQAGQGNLPLSERTFHQGKTFRTVLRETVERVVATKVVPESSLKAINELLAYRTGFFELVGTKQGFTRQFHTDPVGDAWILGTLAEAAADFLSHADLSLVKSCKNSACILYFYDTTKNHTRNWCSMALCGNRMKVAAHYQRIRSQKRRDSSAVGRDASGAG